MKTSNIFLLILLFIITLQSYAFSQYISVEYKKELLTEARKFQEDFHKNQYPEDKYNILISAGEYADMTVLKPEEEEINSIIGAYSYIKYMENLKTFFSTGDSFEQYKFITVAIRLYTEYYEIEPDEKLAKHLAYLHKAQQKSELKPYIHYGFFKNDIFNFSIATPAFDYFENLSLSCFQIEAGNNSTNEIDFSRFTFYIYTTDGEKLEEIDLVKNKEFYDELPPMPDGYIFGNIGILDTDRVLKLFPLIKNEKKIKKVVMEDTLSDFKMEALFFENIL